MIFVVTVWVFATAKKTKGEGGRREILYPVVIVACASIYLHRRRIL